MKTFVSQYIITMMGLTHTQAMLSSPHPYHEVQPDGETILLKIQGDPFDSYVSDMDGFTVVKNKAGEFVYAEMESNGDIGPSQARVGHKSKGQTKGKAKGIRPKHANCKGKICDKDKDRRKLRGNEPRRTNEMFTGTLKNLVVLMQWSDHVEGDFPTREEIDILVNHNGPHTLCPTGSLRDVFLENSYGALSLESTVVEWVPMDNTQSYYANGDRGLTTLTHDAIRYALKYLDTNSLVDFSEFDRDNDGYVDSITFLHSGNGAEWGGTDAHGADYVDRIWSHKWAIFTGAFTSKSGVKVFNYHISPAVWGRSGTTIGRVGVIAHETGHFLGLPDLYDSDGGGTGIGSYGLMANSWGFSGTQYHPPHLSAWSKIKLGWANATTPIEGINRVEAAELQDPTHPQIYKIDQGFPEGEYLLIENRQPIGFDGAMPQGGLVIYHIDENAALNVEGFPGQLLWPTNGNHYKVALVQADGQYHLEKGVGRGDKDDVFHAGGASQLLPSDLSETGPFPNTDSYMSGVILQTNVRVTDISASGNIMSFNYHVGEATSAPSPSPTSQPSSSPSAAPVATEAPTWTPSSSPSVPPSAVPSATPTHSPTLSPTHTPSAYTPSAYTPSAYTPSASPTLQPTPTARPSSTEPPTSVPSARPSSSPTVAPSATATKSPTYYPTITPSVAPTAAPSLAPVDTCSAHGDLCFSNSQCCSRSCSGRKNKRKCS